MKVYEVKFELEFGVERVDFIVSESVKAVAEYTEMLYGENCVVTSVRFSHYLEEL